MNAEFFALAFSAALNPKLLALDLLLIENRRPRAMFLCVLLAGMTVALTIGLLDVLTVHADAISHQGKASAGVDLALGLLLLAVGMLLASGRSSRNTNGMMISKNSMTTNTTTAMTWVAVEYFPVTRWCSAVR